jgi:hypothetical protein
MVRYIAVTLYVSALLLSCVSEHSEQKTAAIESDEQLSQIEVSAAEAEEPVESSESLEPVEAVPADESVFDPQEPPEEIYLATKSDLQDLVRRLDRIIRARDYGQWVELLSKDYLELISSEAFLDEISQQPRLKAQRIVLSSNYDYFVNVVVTSRVNLQADDIAFITETRVAVFTIYENGQKIRIYTFDKTPDGWRIVN